MSTKIIVTQKKSLIGQNKDQRATVRGLGLKRINHSVELKDTPAIRGMVEKVQHLVDVKVMAGEATLSGARHR
jgi:large subunit ribosomal protein L30